MKIARNIAITLICVILGVMVAWQYKSVNYNQGLAAFEKMREDQLKTELIKLQNTQNELRARIAELEKENRAFESAKAGDDDLAKQIQTNLQNARIFAGLVDVKGKGLIITLDNYGYATVEDTDILDVVNELRASGAQAISVNEERVVAMTEIREAGAYIMVNGKQMMPPFVIKAISDPGKLERSLRMLGGVVESLEQLQLKVTLKQDDNILIKKFVDERTTIKTDLLTPVE